MNIDGKTRVTFTLAGIVAAVLGIPPTLIWMHNTVAGHLDAHLTTSTKNDETVAQVKNLAASTESLAQAVKRTSDELHDHAKAEELKSSKQALNLLRGQLSDTKLWEAANRENEISRARKNDLTSQIERVSNYVQCMDAGRTNCSQ